MSCRAVRTHNVGVAPLAAILCGLVVGVVGGCTSTKVSGPYSPQTDSMRDPATSQKLWQEAVACTDDNPAKAEKLLREALTLDLYNGPAHNNLGVLYLRQGKLYESAGEFEWARQLLPGHPDPRMNLALTLEKAGKVDEALSTYATALEVYPDHVPTMQAMTRLQLRSGKIDPTTRHMLGEIAMRGESERWPDWPTTQSIKMEK